VILGLGLESSCDETAASIVADGRKVLSNRISSQIDIHRAFNGVVPEIASRAHLEIVNELVREALEEAGISFGDLSYVSATTHPGLVGSLLVASQSAKAVSFTLGIPFIAVNHLEAHLHAAFIEHDDLVFPFIGLLVSGGNTLLCEVHASGDMRLLGRTGDDAVGEAYDKVAKILGLGYPGGPVIDKLARTAKVRSTVFPRMLVRHDDYSFSYSGLKTAVMVYHRNNPTADAAEIVWGFQESALEILVRRTMTASKNLGIPRIVVAGGVASNSRLRELFAKACVSGEKVCFPSPIFCTDNAAMVAVCAHSYYKRGEYTPLNADVSARYIFPPAV
jgi:N6-L-threonylcarbamoyladenine synthase